LQLIIPVSLLYAKSNPAKTKKNVLLITIDTLRADRLSCYNKEYLLTPNIDSFAEKGVLFSRAFANTSTTLPSHTNILLGTSPLYHGVHDNLNFVVRDDFLTLTEHLKANGYATAAFVGAYPLDSRFGLAQGFDKYDDEYPHDYNQQLSRLERRAEDVIDKALEEMNSLDSPWFVWIHCYDPHLPYEPPEPFKNKYEKNPYDGEVAYVDLALGKLIGYMEKNRLFEKTVIVFTGDHGESLGEHGEASHGFYAYNTSIWIPFIVNIPGIKPKRVDQYVSHLDIFPTICEAVEVEKPSFLHGVSLLPVLKGKSLPDRTIYFESMYPYYSHGWAPLLGFLDRKEKFIESPIPELYDLEIDFDELNNLATQKKLDGYRAQMEKIIYAQTSSNNVKSKQMLDREALKKLKSLGYISTSRDLNKKNFGPEDDIKTLLPFHNLTHKAMIHYGGGRTQKAIEILRNVIKERKDIGIAYQRLSELYVNEGQADKALEILREGLSNVSREYDIYRSYIKVLRIAKKYDEIIENFSEEIYREVSTDPEIWNTLGFAYSKRNEWDKAIEAYNQALSLDLNYAQAYFNLGDAYFSLANKNRDQGLIQKSLENYKKAIEVDPIYPSPYFGLGMVFRQIGNFDEAISYWIKSIELQPDFDMAIYYLGLVYLEKGDKSKALACFNTLKEKFFSHYPEEQKQHIEALIAECER
jgi:arylsulfatase A-like enzyme/Flp pilus assembly protein TadD